MLAAAAALFAHVLKDNGQHDEAADDGVGKAENVDKRLHVLQH